MENIKKYLDALSNCELTGGDSFDSYRLNGYSLSEYNDAMEELYFGFKIELLEMSYSIPEYIAITRRIEAAKTKAAELKTTVSKAVEGDINLAFPAIKLYQNYLNWVNKTAELAENISIMKLSQSAPTFNTKSENRVADSQSGPASEAAEESPVPITAPTSDEEERRSFNDKKTSHPGEYWGYKEMEAGEGISHATAWKIVGDSYFLPAIRYVGRNLRVDIEMLHKLQKQRTAEKKKPIGDRPQRKKKTPTQ